MKIFVAGIGSTKNVPLLCKKHGLNKLYSFMSEKNLIRKYDYDVPLMVDSGAHVYNKVDVKVVGMKRSMALPPIEKHLEDYMSFMFQNNPNFHYVELDVYTRLTMDMLDRCEAQARAVGRKYIRVYHKHMDNGSLEILKTWIDRGNTYIGLGNDCLPIFNKIFKLTRDKIKYHGFALLRKDVLEQYPFYSVDATSPIMSYLFGSAYSKKSMKLIPKGKLIEDRSLHVIEGNQSRADKSFEAVASLQEYLTKLWEKRGVVWND